MIEHAVPMAIEDSFEDGSLPGVKALYCVDQVRHIRALHSHEDALEIAYIFEGRGLHMIGDATYETQAGDVAIFNAGALHAEQPHPDWEGDFGYFSLAITDLHLKGLPPGALIEPGRLPLLHLSPEEGDHIRALFHILMEELRSEQPGEVCRSLAIALLLLVKKKLQETEPVMTPPLDKLTRRVKDYIDAHYREELTLTDIAAAVEASPYHFSRRFKEQTGMSPVQYLINRRIGFAQNLLQDTTDSVTRIAELSGYENANYFNTVFKKNIGMSPRVYRQFFKFSGLPK